MLHALLEINIFLSAFAMLSNRNIPLSLNQDIFAWDAKLSLVWEIEQN